MSSPAFYFFFPGDSIINVSEVLIINEIIAVVFTSKGFGLSSVRPMFFQTLRQVVGNTGIEYSPFGIGDNVDLVMVLFVDVHSVFIVVVSEMPPIVGMTRVITIQRVVQNPGSGLFLCLLQTHSPSLQKKNL